ncbi:Transposase IS66 family protein, partial [Novosphingobium sp. B1]
DAVAKVIAYLQNDWDGFTTFLADGRICLSNNAAERQLRSVASRKKSLVVRRLRSRWPARRNDVQPLWHRAS